MIDTISDWVSSPKFIESYEFMHSYDEIDKNMVSKC